jgi:hypothetical protein
MALLAAAWLWVAGQYVPDETLGMMLLALVRTVAPALGYVLPVAAAVFCWSRLLRRFFMPEAGLAVALSTGLAIHLWLCWVLGWLGLLSTPVAITLAMLPVVADIGSRSHGTSLQSADRPRAPFAVPWPAVWLAMPVSLLLLAASIPPGLIWQIEANGYDVLSYHLQLPREWHQSGALSLLSHNVYSALPSLGEAGYMHGFAWFSGELSYAVFGAQFLHAACALLAAGVVSQIVFDAGKKVSQGLPGQADKTSPRKVGKQVDQDENDDEDRAIDPALDRLPMIVAAGFFLAMPWVLITGSLAYNEMFAIALAGAGLAHAARSQKPTLKDAALVGFLLAAGTMAKLTAGPMLAVPAVVVLIAQRLRAARAECAERAPQTGGKGISPVSILKPVGLLLAVVGLVGLLTLSPYFIRNFKATSNPVFPFATSLLGTGHWTSQQAQAWHAGHAPVGTLRQRLTQLDRHWLRSAGYGAFSGRELSHLEKARETRNVAVFREEFGIPAFWTLAGASLLVCLFFRPTRLLAAILGLTVLWQVVFWIVGTHIQSRFLIFSLLPGCALVGLAIMRLSLTESRRIVRPVGCIFIGFFSLFALQVFWGQTPRRVDETTGAQAAIAACSLVGNLGHTATQGWSMDQTPMNGLPPGSKVMLVADASRLLYTHVPMSYHSAFDAEPLGDILRAHPAAEPDRAGKVTQALKAKGITHVWVHWSELDRLHNTYGYDKDVTMASLGPIVRTWTIVPEASSPSATLFVLP